MRVLERREKIDLRRADMQLELLEELVGEGIITKNIINAILKLQVEDGSFPLVVSEGIPNDCHYYYVRKPSYISMAMLAYSLQKEYRQDVYDAIQKGFNFINQYQFGGHGYDEWQERLKNVEMFIRRGLYAQGNKEFNTKIDKIINGARIQLENNATQFGFGSWGLEANSLSRLLSNYVWYVSYGSNLLEDRFMKYINNTSSKALPIGKDRITINHPLYFAKSSSRWNYSGVAFLDQNKEGKAYGMAYLITKEQLEEIQNMEGPTWYGNRLVLGKHANGIEMVTLTNNNSLNPTLPSKEYLEVLGAGLEEAYGLSLKEIKEYLDTDLELDTSRKHVDMILRNK